MSLLILYPVETGIAVVTPNEACGLTVEEIAEKDVPAGVPYVFMQSEDLPDPTFRVAWECDFSSPDGIGVGAKDWYAARGIA
jgi:hypothetical protein